MSRRRKRRLAEGRRDHMILSRTGAVLGYEWKRQVQKRQVMRGGDVFRIRYNKKRLCTKGPSVVDDG